METLDRRGFMIGTAASALAAGSGFAQESYPTHAITILNAFPPGGINDIVTRPFASTLEPLLKQPVVVETKAGAGGQVGAQVAAVAKPDGYTLLSHNNGISGYEEVDKLFGRTPKTTPADFIPLARLVADPLVVVTNEQQPYKTLKDFVDDAKTRGDTIVYSSGGLYGATHQPVALLEKVTGLPKMRHLPTNGGGPAIIALLGNNAQIATQSISATLQYVKAGKLRALASFGGTRSKALPDVPTVAETVPGYEASVWYGIVGPKGMPPEAIETLNKAVNAALADPKMQARIAELGGTPMPLSPAAFGKLLADETEKWAKVVKFANISVE